MRIENLTSRQIELLNALWGLDSQEEVEQFQATLSKEELAQSESLIRMMMLALIDDMLFGAEPEDCSEAGEYLEKFRL